MGSDVGENEGGRKDWRERGEKEANWM